MVAFGIVKEDRNRFKRVLDNLHVAKESLEVANHHRNWRTFAMQKCTSLEENELMFTSPIITSKANAASIRSSLVKLIESTGEVVRGSDEEVLFCMNLDFIEI